MTVDVDHRRALGQAAFSCPDCAEHIKRLAAANEDLEQAERDLRDARRRIKKLEKERDSNPKPSRRKLTDAQLREHVLYPQAQEIWVWWKEQVSPKAREFSGKRLVNVIDRLEAGYTVKQLKLAVYGAARHPTVLYGKTHNDLELIAREPHKVDDFMARGQLALDEDRRLGLSVATAPDDHAQRREMVK